MGPTILFTHLKIILLQCFQFSVFSNNKLNPNGPVMDVVGLVYDVNPVLRAVMTLRHHSMMLSSQLFQEV